MLIQRTASLPTDLSSPAEQDAEQPSLFASPGDDVHPPAVVEIPRGLGRTGLGYYGIHLADEFGDPILHSYAQAGMGGDGGIKHQALQGPEDSDT